MSALYEETDPTVAARGFAARHSQSGYRLDFSIASLETEIDQMLETTLFPRGRAEGTLEQDSDLAGLVAYVGETLRQAFDGRWGDGFVSRGDNFYTAFVEFGAYKYWPGHFISYRLINGPREGTFAQHLNPLLGDLRGGTST